MERHRSHCQISGGLPLRCLRHVACATIGAALMSFETDSKVCAHYFAAPLLFSNGAAMLDEF